MKTKIANRIDEEPPENMPAETAFPFVYIRTKACSYLTKGTNKYRKEDYFHMPRTRSKKILALIKKGAMQIVDWKGWEQENPLTKLGIKGFNSLMATFYFQLVSQKTVPIKNDMNGKKYYILDKMTMQHAVTKEIIVLYNLVEYNKISDPVPPFDEFEKTLK